MAEIIAEKGSSWQISGKAGRLCDSAPGEEKDLSESERELLREMIRALRSIRFGSVVLTVHDGRLVEINRSERIRRGSSQQKG